MWQKANSWKALTAGLLFFGSVALAGENYWVQAAKTDLKDSAGAAGKKVAELKRGDELTVLKKEGTWFQVQYGKTTGWVSKIFIADHKPIGNAELSKEVKVSQEQASRRRSSSYAVSASTRGLSAEGRAREGRAKYQSDYNALNEVEKYKVDEKAVQKFKKDAEAAPGSQQ